MRNIKLKVFKNYISLEEVVYLTSGTYKHDICVFEFSDDWKDYDKYAVFATENESYKCAILENQCEIPEEISCHEQVFGIGVYGQQIQDNKVLVRESTELNYLTYSEGAYKEGLKESEAVSDITIYERYIAEMNKILSALKDEHKNAVLEIKDVTIESKKDIESYTNDLLESFNKNYESKIAEYNSNADERKEEINEIANEVSKDRLEIEAMKKSIETSETNAKESEQNAQNSANNASKSESNITNIEKNINDLKKDIDNTKTQIDEKAKEVKNNSDIAIEQAKVATEQATLSGQNANKTSADKEDISQMKVSIEASEDNIEEIEKNVQAIKDDIEAAKNETLEAKEEVENSLENERIISDKKYARAIDSDVISVDNFGQVDVEQDGYMKDVEIESALPEITQEKREGYNRLDISTLQELDQDGVKLTKENGVVTLNGRSTATFFIDAYIVGSSSAYEEFLPAGTYTVSGITGEVLSPNFGILIVIKHLDESKTTIIQNGENKVFNVADSDIFRVFIRIPQNLQLNNIVIKPMIVLGTENKDFEQYGSSPSLNYPSEFKNILSSFNIKNTVDEIEKYNKQITLPENKFLGNFNGYKNIIQNGKLKCNLKIYKLDANMDFSVNDTGTTGVQFLTPIIEDLKSNLSAKNILSTISKNLVGSTASKKIRFIIPYKELGTTSENTKAEHIAALKNKLSNIRGEFLYPVDNEEETELEDINLPLYKGINNISLEDLKLNFKYNISIEKYIEKNNENERKISDSKYARALKTKVEDVEQTQIYAENDEVENLTIKGAELTQKTREGYNQLKNTGASRTHNGIDFTVNADGTVLANGTANGGTSGTSLSQINIHDEEIQFEAGDYTIQDCKAYVVYEDNSYEWFDGLTKATSKTFDKSFKITDVYIQVNPGTTVNNKLYYPMITKGTENKEYEQYGASPSLNYPSEIQVKKEQNISICRKNILDTNDINKSSSDIATISKNDGGININGTPTSTFLTIKSVDLNVPIKAGTKLFMNYGKTKKLLKDNTDFSPYFWLVNKNGTLFKTLNRNNIINGYSVEQEIYRISFGIEALVVGKEYSEDIYIELEISDKQPTEFQKYEATDITIPLQNLAIGDYSDVIDKNSGIQDKVIKKIIFTGEENWILVPETNTFYIQDVNDYKRIYNKTIGICNYFPFQSNVGSSVDVKDGHISMFGGSFNSISRIYIKSSYFNNDLDAFKLWLSENYKKGNPVIFYYVLEFSDKISLPSEVKQELDKFKLYDNLNNVFIDVGSLSFRYNKSLLRALEEQSELSASLLERIQALEAAQVNSVGGN